jgi:hypothetical protein
MRKKYRMPKNAAELEEKYLRSEQKWPMGIHTRERMEALIMLLACAEKILALLSKREPRPLTAWQRFFGAGIKAGKTPQQVGAEWRSRRSA